jgi:hypothetical protein
MIANGKLIERLIVGCVFACCLASKLHAQPRLSISNAWPDTVQVNWTNQVGTSYHVWFSTNLAAPFSLLEDAFSPDETVSVYTSTTDSPLGFFRIQVPTNATTASAQIFTPSNSVTVSGEIAVRMGAQLGTQVQGVNLYLDDLLVGYLNSGGMKFDLDTTHFANGSHTLYVGAVDTANNETLSSSITLDFENSVRWLDACSMFNSFVPIDVDSDIYPADWLVTVTDTNGTIVRTISGSTTDGIIQTTWDGTDDNNQPLPVENLYQITVDVVETSGSSMMMASRSASSLETAAPAQINAYGVAEYQRQESLPNPMDAYLETLKIYEQLTPQEQLVYPPLPPQPVDNPNAMITVKMSAREAFLASHATTSTALSSARLSASTASANASSDLQHGSTKTLAWWENPWSSKQTIVARVPIPGLLGTTVTSDCNQISELIGAADGVVGNNRGVYGGGAVQVISTGSDVYGLTNQFADANVTAFYFYGHGTASGNAIGTQSAVISAKTVGKLLGNYYVPVLGANFGANAGKQAMVTHKPFNFIFLDGCNTGLGDFPEAFGIPKAVKALEYDSPHSELHKRAFIGWSGPVTFQFDQAHINWTLKFWSTWLDGDAYDTTVETARNAAYSNQPSVNSNVPDKSYGSRTLTWSN